MRGKGRLNQKLPDNWSIPPTIRDTCKMKGLNCLPLLLVMTACTDGSPSSASTEPAPAISDSIESMEASGKLPKLDRSGDLAGPDEDGNGIRDDIEQYIATRFPAEAQGAAAKFAARANQLVLDVNLLDENEVRQANQKATRATACIYTVFGESDSGQAPAAVSRDIEAVTFNTAQRLKRYMEFNQKLDGMSWSLPEGDTCE